MIAILEEKKNIADELFDKVNTLILKDVHYTSEMFQFLAYPWLEMDAYMYCNPR